MSAEVLDFLIADHGSVITLLPFSDGAREWVDEWIDSSAPRFGRQIVIERRYFAEIYEAIKNDGFTIA